MNVPTTNEDYADAYIEAEANPLPLAKFNKAGQFVYTSDGKPLPKGRYIAIVPETQVGYIKFMGEGVPPERRQGPLFGGFRMPPREELGDLDQTLWDEGLDGKPADPWQHQIMLVLQNEETAELVAFAATSKSGRRSAATLLQHYRRSQRTHPGTLPIVELVSGSYKHERYGSVSIPIFKPVGMTSADKAAKPDNFDDSIPF
jgi:hypothetical protein